MAQKRPRPFWLLHVLMQHDRLSRLVLDTAENLRLNVSAGLFGARRRCSDGPATRLRRPSTRDYPGERPINAPSLPFKNRWSPRFSVLSLCLSRACLGKMIIIFVYKWLKKTVFLPLLINGTKTAENLNCS